MNLCTGIDMDFLMGIYLEGSSRMLPNLMRVRGVFKTTLFGIPILNDWYETEKKLFLLDAFALIFRAHFAFSKNPRINSKGVNTSAVFGFVNSLLEILKKEKNGS